MLSRDEGQLDDAEDSSTGNRKPSGSRAAVAVDDTNQRRRDSSCQAAAGHGETVDLSKDLWRRSGVFEEDESGRVDDDANETLKDERDVDESRSHVLGPSADEG